MDFTLRMLAETIAADHTADPLVGRTVAASDADDFEYLVLQRALEEWDFASSSEEDVEVLREELRSALGREAVAFADEDAAALAARQFTLDGRPAEIADFIAANEFDSEDVEYMLALDVGQSIRYGGGAAAEFLLVRIA